MIVHIAHQLPPETHGGVESHVLSLARGQKEKGHDVFLIAGSLSPWENVGGAMEQLEGFDIFRVHRQDLSFDAWDRMFCPQMADLIVEKLLELNPDVVHLHHWIRLSQDLGRRITEAGFKLVITLHDLATSCPRGFRMKPDETPCFETLSPANCLHCAPRWPWMSDAETSRELEFFARSSRSEISCAHAVLCASQAVKAIVLDGLAVPELADSIDVIPFGHNRVFPSRALKPETHDGVFRLAYWGSITHRKGVELLVTAFGGLTRGRESGSRAIELHVFGACDLPEREAALVDAAQRLNVTFHGHFEYQDIVAAEIDAAVFPSLCIETYGMVLDEAFELGVPVIVPNLGAFKERAGRAGRLFEVNDVGSLTRALGAFVDDPSLYAESKRAVPNSIPLFEDYVASVLEVYSRPPRGMQPDVLPITAEERLRHQFMRSLTPFQKLLERGEGKDYGPR